MADVSYLNVNGTVFTIDDLSTTQEVEDMRVGADGSTYPTAGDAIREQISDINTTLNGVSDDIESLYDSADTIKTDITNVQNDISNLQSSVSTLETTQDNLQNSIAEQFSASASYEIGDYCLYNGTLYKATAAHTGEWNDSDFSVVTVGEELNGAIEDASGAKEAAQSMNLYKAGVLVNTVSGSTVSFVPDDSVSNILELTANINPVQSGTGDPSPSNIRPLVGVDEITISYSGEDTTSPESITVNWGAEQGNVYAGYVDVVAGILYKYPYYPSYSGQSLVGQWLSSMDVYAEGAIPTAGAEVVNIGGTPTAVSITPTEIPVIAGETNNVQVDTGDVTVKYAADVKSYIDSMVAAAVSALSE